MRTTVYLEETCIEKLNETKIKLDISRNRLVLMLLERIAKRGDFQAKSFKPVCYQECSPGSKRKTMHVRFDPANYEKAQDMRRNFKYSVSWFVVYGIDNFLDEILDEFTGTGDYENKTVNYEQNFLAISDVYGNVQGFCSFWGIPEKKYITELLL